MTCDAFRTLALGGNGVRDAEVAAHEAQCADCRQWLARFVEGEATWRSQPGDLARDVLDRTGGSACGRAQLLLASDHDEALAGFERRLVESHLERCSSCREFAAGLDAALRTLPALATLDPGAGFAARVWARTSRKPAAKQWADWSRARWGHWVQRPRFAWEAAYVAIVCWVLIFGGPVTAWEWSKAKVATMADRPIPGRIVDLRADVPRLTAALASEAAPRVTEVQSLASRFTAWLAERWAATTVWAAYVLGRLDAAFEAARERAADWLEALSGRDPDADTEPRAGPVRSRE